MKVRIEIVDGLPEDEIVIRCARVDEQVQKLQRVISEQGGKAPQLVFYRDGQEFYFPIDEVLFFETEGDQVYAYTKADTYRIKFRLYELEKLLPRHFIRSAKSTIVNTRMIYSIKRDLTASSLIQFAGTHRKVYVSRHYYHALNERMNERGVSPGKEVDKR